MAGSKCDTFVSSLLTFWNLPDNTKPAVFVTLRYSCPAALGKDYDFGFGRKFHSGSFQAPRLPQHNAVISFPNRPWTYSRARSFSCIPGNKNHDTPNASRHFPHMDLDSSFGRSPAVNCRPIDTTMSSMVHFLLGEKETRHVIVHAAHQQDDRTPRYQWARLVVRLCRVIIVFFFRGFSHEYQQFWATHGPARDRKPGAYVGTATRSGLRRAEPDSHGREPAMDPRGGRHARRTPRFHGHGG